MYYLFFNFYFLCLKLCIFMYTSKRKKQLLLFIKLHDKLLLIKNNLNFFKIVNRILKICPILNKYYILIIVIISNNLVLIKNKKKYLIIYLVVCMFNYLII